VSAIFLNSLRCFSFAFIWFTYIIHHCRVLFSSSPPSNTIVSFGASPPSLPSAAVKLTGAPPSPPLLGRAWAGNAAVSVWFEAPADDGGAPITSYVIETDDGGRVAR
jgi:hypothetical protein